jgi:crotonobetainyl-CoA:carnitine CoA-transferase CaiB-like acyl-CoA transferase
MADQVALLDGVRVVDLAGEPAAMACRVLADLGADVVLVEAPQGSPFGSFLTTGLHGVPARAASSYRVRRIPCWTGCSRMPIS